MTEVDKNVNLNGYHGGFASNIPSTQLQKCSNNDVDMVFSLEKKASFWINIPIIFIAYPISAILAGYIDISIGISYCVKIIFEFFIILMS